MGYSHALSGLQEMVEERMSPGSSQGEVPGCEGLLELSSWVILVEAQNKAEALSDILLVLAYCQRCSECIGLWLCLTRCAYNLPHHETGLLREHAEKVPVVSPGAFGPLQKVSPVAGSASSC